MFGFEFLNYGAQILHSKDLEDMRSAILSDDDQEIDCNVSDFCREAGRKDRVFDRTLKQVGPQ